MHDFKVKDSEKIYSGRIVGMSVETIVLPDGRETRREVVHHPGAAAIVPMLSPDEVVLIRQFRYSSKRAIWEIPAGTLEAGEMPLACAERELIEETGYRAGAMKPLGGFFTSPGFCTEFLHLFLATHLEICDSNLDKDEQLEVHIVRLEEAIRWLSEGKIVDAKTAVGLLKVSSMESAELN